MLNRGILLFFLVMVCFAQVSIAEVYTVDEVLVEGTRRVDLSSVEAVLSVSPGQTVSVEDIDRDIQAIYGLRRFEDVSADVVQRAGVSTLIYRVKERPLVRRIEFVGNKALKRDKLRSLVDIKTPDIYDPRSPEKSIELIRKAYEEEGYYAAQVDVKADVSLNNDVTLTFEIDEGTKVLIRNIYFEGNTVFTDKELRKSIVTRERWWLSWMTGRGAYKEDVLQNDLEIIADQYYNEGYVQIKVKQPLVKLADDRESLDIYIEIEEGSQFYVGAVDVQGDLVKSREELLGMVKIHDGAVFSRRQLREDIVALNDFYSDLGYAYVNVSPLTRVDPETRKINVAFDIEQGVQVRIGTINIRGNTKTRDKVIRREMALVEGDLFSASKVKKSRSRINNLGFFDEVNVSTSKGLDEEHMNLDVDVKERPTGTFSIGFGYSSVDGFVGQGSVSQDNFLGKAWRLNLAASLGGSSTTYRVGLLDPYFLDSKVSLGFDIYKTEREWSDFTRKTTGGDIKFGFPLWENTRTFFVYRYEDKEITDVDSDASSLIKDQEGTSTLSSISASITRNTTDYRPDPTKGHISEFSLELAGLGGTEKFAKYVVDHRTFFPMKWGTVFSIHGQVGYVQGLGGEDVPIDERFFLGGINTLRGFSTREVGPRVKTVTQVVDPTTGQVISETSDFEYTGGEKEAYFNLEYTFPIAKDMGLKGVLFFDTGNAWAEDEEFFSDMRYSAGGGIRWLSPMGPLRLEWGYNLDPKDDEDNSQFEFSIGKFF